MRYISIRRRRNAIKMHTCKAVVVAQLVERSLPTPEVRSQFESGHRQTFISDIYLFIVNCIEKTEIKIKRPGMAFFKLIRVNKPVYNQLKAFLLKFLAFK